MIKAVIFFRRRPDLALDAFHAHWRTRHAPLVVRLPGLRGYVQNTPLEAGSAFDAVAESSFDDTQAMKMLAKTPEYAAVLADESNFIDRETMGSIITEEHVLKNGPAPGRAFKRITFVKRDASVPVEDFFRRWLEDGKKAAADAAIKRHVQCHCRRTIYDSGRTPAYDGVEMTWYDSVEAARAAPGAEPAALMLASERVVPVP